MSQTKLVEVHVELTIQITDDQITSATIQAQGGFAPTIGAASHTTTNPAVINAVRSLLAHLKDDLNSQDDYIVYQKLPGADAQPFGRRNNQYDATLLMDHCAQNGWPGTELEIRHAGLSIATHKVPEAIAEFEWG